MIEPVTDPEAEILVRDYVCSSCWAHLIRHHKDNKTVVLCSRCDEKTPGYVSKEYVKRYRAQNAADALEASSVLEAILPKKEKKTAQELIKELGF